MSNITLTSILVNPKHEYIHGTNFCDLQGKEFHKTGPLKSPIIKLMFFSHKAKYLETKSYTLKVPNLATVLVICN